jgi:hypothetical protein
VTDGFQAASTRILLTLLDGRFDCGVVGGHATGDEDIEDGHSDIDRLVHCDVRRCQPPGRPYVRDQFGQLTVDLLRSRVPEMEKRG